MSDARYGSEHGSRGSSPPISQSKVASFRARPSKDTQDRGERVRGPAREETASQRYTMPIPGQTPGTTRIRATSDRPLAVNTAGVMASSRLSPPLSSTSREPSQTTLTEHTLRRRSDFPATSSRPIAEASSASEATSHAQSPHVSRTRSNMPPFPHTFERWEVLSSHWEGLTSYWLHRLDSDRDAIAQVVPSASAMTRQINDLSAAGANLFHGLVELQRLRASSDQKFQRWQQETKAAMTKDAETIEALRRDLQNERQTLRDMTRERLKAMGESETAQQECRKAELVISDLRKELAISKKEAKRAWEELGRRESEESVRAQKLKAGHPVTVAGVHVVPMAKHATGGPTYYGSRLYSPPSQHHRGDPDPEGERSSSAVTNPYISTESDAATLDGPRVSTGSRGQKADKAVQSPSPLPEPSPRSGSAFSFEVQPEHFYQQPLQPTLSRDRPATSTPNRPGSSHSAVVRDAVQLISAHRAEDDDDLYDLTPLRELQRPEPDSSFPFAAPRPSSPLEKAGEQPRRATSAGLLTRPARSNTPLAIQEGLAGYPVLSPPDEPQLQQHDSSWEASQTRHHHPTRLSDVQEEREEAHASGSRIA